MPGPSARAKREAASLACDAGGAGGADVSRGQSHSSLSPQALESGRHCLYMRPRRWWQAKSASQHTSSRHAPYLPAQGPAIGVLPTTTAVRSPNFEMMSVPIHFALPQPVRLRHYTYRRGCINGRRLHRSCWQVLDEVPYSPQQVRLDQERLQARSEALTPFAVLIFNLGEAQGEGR